MKRILLALYLFAATLPLSVFVADPLAGKKPLQATTNATEEVTGTRAKDNLCCRVVRRFQRGRHGNILRDDLIRLTGPARKHYPVELRRVVARVEVDGQLREMTFLTNNLQ